MNRIRAFIGYSGVRRRTHPLVDPDPLPPPINHVFAKLPNNVLERIISFSSVKDILTLKATDKFFNNHIVQYPLTLNVEAALNYLYKQKKFSLPQAYAYMLNPARQNYRKLVFQVQEAKRNQGFVKYVATPAPGLANIEELVFCLVLGSSTLSGFFKRFRQRTQQLSASSLLSHTLLGLGHLKIFRLSATNLLYTRQDSQYISTVFNDSLPQLSALPNLRELYLENINMRTDNGWLSEFAQKFPHLETLSLKNCDFISGELLSSKLSFTVLRNIFIINDHVDQRLRFLRITAPFFLGFLLNLLDNMPVKDKLYLETSLDELQVLATKLQEGPWWDFSSFTLSLQDHGSLATHTEQRIFLKFIKQVSALEIDGQNLPGDPLLESFFRDLSLQFLRQSKQNLTKLILKSKDLTPLLILLSNNFTELECLRELHLYFAWDSKLLKAAVLLSLLEQYPALNIHFYYLSEQPYLKAALDNQQYFGRRLSRDLKFTFRRQDSSLTLLDLSCLLLIDEPQSLSQFFLGAYPHLRVLKLPSTVSFLDLLNLQHGMIQEIYLDSPNYALNMEDLQVLRQNFPRLQRLNFKNA